MKVLTQADNLPTHFVGIGASAGGLEALQDLFKNIPNDTGAVFIVIQHLSPDFKSMMPEILAECTSMPVSEVTDGVLALANCVYLLPPKKNIIIAKGKLLLIEPQYDHHAHFPLDIFFRSLAEDQKQRSIGVILSGAGSDGASGVKVLKEYGAMILVQEPKTAKYDSMIQFAIRTGLVDFILPCIDIAKKLADYIHTSPVVSQKASLSSELEATHSELISKILALLKQEKEIDFSLYKYTTISRRIERRLQINQISNLKDYLELLKERRSEKKILAKQLLIGVTRFFREPIAFELIEKLLFDAIKADEHSQEPLRIWSIGCSTGEEAYSIAIICHEILTKLAILRTVKIFATDVETDALTEASAGRYPLSIQQEIGEERIKKYFKLEDNGYVIKQALREMVFFAKHNIFSDPPFSSIHLVLCRNLLIYLQPNIQKKALAAMSFALRAKGILFLGPSESLGELQVNFEIIDLRHKIFRKVVGSHIPVSPSPPSRAITAIPQKEMSSIKLLMRPQRDSQFTHRNFLEEMLISRFVPPCIVLNEQFQALHVYGDVTSYINKMPPGKVTTNLKDLIVSDLSVALSTALLRVKNEKGEVCYTNVVTGQNVIGLRVLYVNEMNQPDIPPYFLVIFEVSSRVLTEVEGTEFNLADQSKQRIKELEKELKKEHENLQLAVEKLEVTNEELQSTNEELMSTNEELQSTNEELQSVNEELFTVNSEYQEKISQLVEVNSYLDNAIESNELASIFLDRNLLIRKYSPVVCKYFNLISSDINRPFYHISHHLHYDGLLNDIAKVSATSESIEKEVETSLGFSLLVKIAPYRTEQTDFNRDIVLTFSIVSLAKK